HESGEHEQYDVLEERYRGERDRAERHRPAEHGGLAEAAREPGNEDPHDEGRDPEAADHDADHRRRKSDARAVDRHEEREEVPAGDAGAARDEDGKEPAV